MQFVKCGFAGDNFPAAVFPCLVGRPMLRYEENLGDRELRVSLRGLQFNRVSTDVIEVAQSSEFI